MIHKLWNKLKNSLWLQPSIYSGIGLCLAIITVTFDTYYLSQLIHLVPDILLTSVDLAIEILSTLAAALLTMTTFTFSIIMVVLTTYSSQFSPRALPNFMTDKTTMRVLGIFLGGFIYSIYSLLFMRKSMGNEYVISAVIGVLFTIVCLVFFIHFIHYIGKSIQVDHLIEKLTKETLQYSKEMKERIQRKQLSITREFNPNFDIKKTSYCKKTVYFQKVDVDELISLASKNDVFIEFHNRIGEFISEDSELFSIYSNKDQIELIQKCEKTITLSHQRSTSQDLSYSTQKLVEIALRATSPAINDPFTAKHCIRNIGKLLSEITPLLEGDMLFMDKENNPRLLIPMESLQNLLYFSFYEFEIKSRSDLPVLGAILDSLILTAKKSSNENKQAVWSFFTYITYYFHERKDLHELDEEFLRVKERMLFEATR